MSTSNNYTLEQNESYARIDWKSTELVQSNYEELELAIRFLFKKEYANIILNTNFHYKNRSNKEGFTMV